MKRKSRVISLDAPVLDISSLVDVSFLLLVFFLVTSTLQKSEAELSSTLPDARSAPGDPPFAVNIQLDRDGVIRVDDEIVDVPNSSAGAPGLDARLEEILSLANLTHVVPLAIVTADDEAPHQRLVDILDTMTARKIENLALSGFKN